MLKSAILFITTTLIASQLLPDAIQNPYKLITDDKLITDQPWAINDPWGIYKGNAFCHNLCMFEGMCQNQSAQPSEEFTIQSPITLGFYGIEIDEGNQIPVNGFINFNWQQIITSDGGHAGAFDINYIPLTASSQINNHSTYFIVDYYKGNLQNSTGFLNLYANNISPAEPGSDIPWGWLFATFKDKPLVYNSSFGLSQLTGQIEMRYYSPSDFYTGICYVNLQRTSFLGEFQANMHPYDKYKFQFQ